MKRDMDLVRHILIAVESADGPMSIPDLTPPDRSYEEVAFHVNLMRSHGLLDASQAIVADAGTYPIGHVDALTWDGFDYLEAIRDNNTWAKTKRVIKEAVGSTTLSVIKQTAELVALGAIKAQLGM